MKQAIKIKDGVWVFEDGHTYFFDKKTLMKKIHGVSEDDAVGEGTLVAPMPGKVFKVLAQIGDAVKKDQPVLVVEAMKMEHTLKAPFDGTVAECFVSVGDQVSLKQELMVLS